MSKKVKLFGLKVLPIWLIVVALVTAGAGAAVGTILAGKVTAEVPVTISQALLVGKPQFDQIEHTPNVAWYDNAGGNLPTDASQTLTQDEIDSDPFTTTTGVDTREYSDIAFSDDTRAEEAVASTAHVQHFFGFYVAPAATDITEITISWEGYVLPDPPTSKQLLIYDENQDLWVDTGETVPAGATNEATITKTYTTGLSDYLVDTPAGYGGYIFFQVAVRDTLHSSPSVHTDYVTLTVKYDAINWDDWDDFTGPQNCENEFYVPDRFIGAHSDDQTAFQAAAEIDTGDKYLIMVPLKNASNQDMMVELALAYPDGITVEVVSADQVGDYDPRVEDLTRTSLNTWKFNLENDALKQDDDDYIYIAVAASDTIVPGYYTIKGKLVQISY